ncbi:MAG: SurA N-terminal domain-containing protein [Deltaproteobacteria bacterium]|nr:SurA N-terminal domain-containing protein [Deltaproteobacteria bacterium]
MRVRASVTLLFAAVILFSAGGESVSAEICNQVVAKVDNHVITLHELNKKLKEMTGLSPDELRQKDDEAFQRTRKQVLEALINEKITEQKVKELGISVKDGEIDAAIERVKKNNQWNQEDLLAYLEKDGLTYEKYREQMKLDLERADLIDFEVKSKVIIREERIKEYYDAHKDAYTSGGKVHLASIFLIPKDPRDGVEARDLVAKGEEILRRIQKGEDFQDLARQYSQGPGAKEGGDLGVFKADHLDPELNKVCDSLPEGGISRLIIRPTGIQIIKVLKKEDVKLKPLEQVRDAIYETLYMEEINRRYTNWIEELRRNSYTESVF